MALDFPSSPTNGQVYGNYYYDATTSAWRSFSSTVNPIPSTLKNLTVSSSETTGVSLKVTPFTTSSVNLQEWYNTSSNVVASMNVAGDLSVNSIALTNKLAPAYGGVPTGSIMMWYTDTPPTGWLICNGQSTSGYTALAAVVGATVPNMQQRVPVGKNAGTFSTLGATGGEETVTLVTANVPAHTHTFSGTTSTDGSHTHALSNNATNMVSDANQGINWATAGGASYGFRNSTILASGNHSHTISGTTGTGSGSGTAHNNLQPYIVINYIIKT